jgi:hydroxymethylglutaryl-CoA lyase
MLPANERGNAVPLRIVEVAPRDGLQNEPVLVSTDEKVAFVELLSRTGVAEIEVGSFVSSRAVPQLADTEEVFRRIARRPGVIYSALVPNERGLIRAGTAGVQKIAVLTAASETFTRRNVNAGIRESLDRVHAVVAGAKQRGMAVRGYISTAVHCPFEGAVEPRRVVTIMQALLDLGVDEISLGDTVGKAAPTEVRRLLDAVLPHIERRRLSLHFHDTYGMGVANVLAAWMDYGIESFDCAAGGLGGCPYAPGASGNVATEDVVYALKACGATLSVNEQDVVAAARRLAGVLGHPPGSRLSRIETGQPALKDMTCSSQS